MDFIKPGNMLQWGKRCFQMLIYFFNYCLTDQLNQSPIAVVISFVKPFQLSRSVCQNDMRVYTHNRKVFASKSKCIVYLNKTFGWKSFFLLLFWRLVTL